MSINLYITDISSILASGDERYRIRLVSSHDITAVTLNIAPVEDVFPVKIVACFSLDRAQFQYQLDTHIDGLTASKTDVLDGILWTAIPERIITFNDLGQLSVLCSARLESESSRFTEELNIYRSYLEKNQLNGTIQVSSVGTGKIHKERDNFVEEAGKYLYKGRREVMISQRRVQHILYEVSFTVLNGSQDDVGVYTCAAERARDRTYVSSLVKVQQHQKPTLILVACGEEAVNQATPHSSESRRVVVHLIENMITCVRCRVFDYEAAWNAKYFDGKRAITLKRDGHSVDRSTAWILLDWHLNVADGGLMELTITFRKPSAERDEGVYQCIASNSLGSDTVAFQVAVVPGRQ